MTAYQTSGATHEVVNQPPPLVGHDVADDAALLDGVVREGAGWALSDLHRLGCLAGSARAQEWGEQADRHGPELRTHDRYGNRIDEVAFNPAWHSLLSVAVTSCLAGAPWASDRVGAHVARTAGFYTWGQVETGHGCPVSMTYAWCRRCATRRNSRRCTSRCSRAGRTTPACASRRRSAACSPAWA